MAKRNRPTPEQISAAFVEAEDDFGEKSTEFLASIVADRLGIEYGDVFVGLEAVHGKGDAND